MPRSRPGRSSSSSSSADSIEPLVDDYEADLPSSFERGRLEHLERSKELLTDVQLYKYSGLVAAVREKRSSIPAALNCPVLFSLKPDYSSPHCFFKLLLISKF